MTAKQIEQFNRMRYALVRIGKLYQSSAQLRRNAERDYGLSADEAIAMSYENVLGDAREAVKGVKALPPPLPRKRAATPSDPREDRNGTA